MLMSMTISELLEHAEGSDGLIRVVGHNDDGIPAFAVIAIRGIPESGEIIAAIEAIEQRWRAKEMAEPQP